MLLQVEEIERRREENSRVNALPSMPPPSPPPTVQLPLGQCAVNYKGREGRTREQQGAFERGACCGGGGGHRPEHGSLPPKREKQCVLWNACTKHHAGKRHGGKEGRKLVYECVQVAPSRQHKINGFNAGAAPASESQGRGSGRPREEDFSRAKSFNY